MDDIRKGLCPLCRHNEIVEAKPTEHIWGAGKNKPQRLAIAETKRPSWGRVLTGSFEDWGPQGLLVAYMCRACGYAQWFVEDPAAVPVDEKVGTRIIKGPDPIGPYR